MKLKRLKFNNTLIAWSVRLVFLYFMCASILLLSGCSSTSTNSISVSTKNNAPIQQGSKTDLAGVKRYPYTTDNIKTIVKPEMTNIFFIINTRGSGQIIETPKPLLSEVLKNELNYKVYVPTYIPQNLDFGYDDFMISDDSFVMVLTPTNNIQQNLIFITEASSSSDKLSKSYKENFVAQNEIKNKSINGYIFNFLSSRYFYFDKQGTQILLRLPSDKIIEKYLPDLVGNNEKKDEFLLKIAESMN